MSSRTPKVTFIILNAAVFLHITIESPLIVNHRQSTQSTSKQAKATMVSQQIQTSRQPVNASANHHTAVTMPETHQATAAAPVVIYEDDDPGMLYCVACLSFFFPFVGFIAMCVLGCGNNLPPNKMQAFWVICAVTLVHHFLFGWGIFGSGTIFFRVKRY